jgi:hypothetical protein
VPQGYFRYNEEPIEDYRDRLYQQYRLPFVIGPLQDIPLSFIEIINPLLHPKIISFVRTLPPHLRTSKKIYAKWVDKLLPQIPYATIPAIPEPYQISESANNQQMFLQFFYDQSAKQLFGNELMKHLQSNWKIKEDSNTTLHSSWKRRVKNMIPISVKKFLRNRVTGYELKTSSLGLRALIIYRMQEILRSASK